MISLIKKCEEIIRYLVIGVLTTLISLAVYYLLVYTVFDPNVALELQITNVISWIASVTFAYFTNRKFVFKTREKATIKEASAFYLSRVSTLILEIFIMYLLVTVLKFNDKIIKILAQVLVIIFNYVLSKFLVFKSRRVE